MAYVAKFELDGGTPEFYEAVCERLNFPAEIPDGLMSHCAFPTDQGFCVCEFWDSQQSQQAFWSAKLEQSIAAVSQEMGIAPDDVDLQLTDAHMAYARDLRPVHA